LPRSRTWTGANSGAAGAIVGLYVGMGIVAAAMFA
jgi:hypothetical protein